MCGISTVLAPGLVRRALADGKVDVDSATVADYKKALPRLLARMRAYMPEEEAQAHARRIAGWLASIEPERDERETGAGTDGITEGSVASRAAGRPLATTPRGFSRASVQAALQERSTSEPERSRPAGLPEVAEGAVTEGGEGDEFTLVGRRWTADEEKYLRSLGSSGAHPLAEDEAVPKRRC